MLSSFMITDVLACVLAARMTFLKKSLGMASAAPTRQLRSL
jgi:hypothetical protein